MSATRDWKQRSRLIMKPERLGVSGITLFGRYNYRQAHPALPDHAHSRDIEICYLVKGRQSYRVAGETCRLRGGDIFITFPGETHSTGGSPEEKGVLYWISLRAPLRRNQAVAGLPGPLSGIVIESLLGIRRRHFRGSWKMKDLLDAAAGVCQEPGSPLDGARFACLIQSFLLEVIDGAEDPPEIARGRPLAAVLRAVRAQPGGDWSVPEMAERAGLSTPRFKARFKEENGIPPREFVLRTRIEAAEKRLALGRDSVTDIALELGFSSSQYFATVFKRFTGRTPRGRRFGTMRI